MPRTHPPVLVVAAALSLAACGSSSTSPPPPAAVNCESPAAVTLSPGQYLVTDLEVSNGCFRVPAPGADAEYHLAVVSGAGQVTNSGVSGPYTLRVGAPGAVTPASAGGSPGVSVVIQSEEVPLPARFDRTLRTRERELAADRNNRLPMMAAPAILAPPAVGSERKFSVCKDLQCKTFDTVTAVARVVDQYAAIYLDKVIPAYADSFTQADLEELARTFNTYHHPIDVNAFGAESDKDLNSVVMILLTDAVNSLTTDCSKGRILGFFWGGDLLNIAGSNGGEVFFAMVPAAATSGCTAATRKATLDRVKPTLVHEFQHMISFNQHALVRNGEQEETWLNEALSHTAEELAGRLIPASECAGFPGNNPCRSQYASGDITNAWDYLEQTHANWLVAPGSSSGTLAERGAGWLFVRWLADQFATDSLGLNVTRALVQTSRVGADNVATVAGESFASLVGEWQLAVYTDDLAGFTPASPRLTYTLWGFRKVFLDNCCTSGAPFSRPFPMQPSEVSPSVFPYLNSGTLHGGSGTHYKLTLPAGSQGADLLVSRSTGNTAVDAALSARLAIVRIR